MAENLLATGVDEALWAGTQIAAQLPGQLSLDLLLTHATSKARAGSYHVITELAKLCPANSPRRYDALRVALLGTEVQNAIAAADWAKTIPNRESQEEATLLRSAFDYWIGIEEPYPKNGGVIPPSPRSSLAAALYETGHANFDTLSKWTADSPL